jgi:hypothetical protein
MAAFTVGPRKATEIPDRVETTRFRDCSDHTENTAFNNFCVAVSLTYCDYVATAVVYIAITLK